MGSPFHVGVLWLAWACSWAEEEQIIRNVFPIILAPHALDMDCEHQASCFFCWRLAE